MASKYFIQKGGKTFGPLSSSDLMKLAQSGKLAPADLVWKEGIKTKVPAEQVKGLTFKSPEVVPTVPVQADNPSPVKDNVPPIKSDPVTSSDQREFYYEISGEREGPMSFSELQTLVQQGVVTKQTQVWHDGLEDWTPASTIDELAVIFPVPKKTPPPLLKTAPPPVIAELSQTANDPVPTAGFQIQTEPVSVPHDGEQLAQKSSNGRTNSVGERWANLSVRHKQILGVAGGVLILLLILVLIVPGSNSGSSSGGSSSQDNTRGWYLPNGQFLKAGASIKEVESIIRLRGAPEARSKKFRSPNGDRTFTYQNDETGWYLQFVKAPNGTVHEEFLGNVKDTEMQDVTIISVPKGHEYAR